MSTLSRKYMYIIASLLIIILILGGALAYYVLTPVSTPKKPIVIRFWHAYNPVEAEKVAKLVEEFMKENPDIKVEMEAIPYGALHDKLITAMAAGTAPDVVRMDIIWVPEFASIGALLELDEFIERDNIDLNNFFPGPLETCKWNGHYYGLPLDTNTRVLFYRKDLFAEAGIDHPPRTWQELLEFAKKLTKDKDGDGKIDQYGLAIGGAWPWHFFPFLWQNGGDFLDEDMKKCIINSTEGVEALQFLVDLIHKYKVAEYGTDVWRGFALGRYAMMIMGPWGNPLVASVDKEVAEEKTGVALLFKGKYAASIVGGEDVVIFRQTKHPEAAWKFVKFLISERFQLEMFEVGQIPVLRSLVPKLSTDPYYKVFMEQLETARARTPHPKFAQMKEIIHREVEAALLGLKTPKEALDAIAAEVNKILGS